MKLHVIRLMLQKEAASPVDQWALLHYWNIGFQQLIPQINQKQAFHPPN